MPHRLVLFRQASAYLLAGLFVLLTRESLPAVTLVTYMFTNYSSNLNTSTAADSGSVAVNVTAGSLIDSVDGAGALAAFSSTTDAYFARGTSPLTSSQANAISGNDYISFTIQPNSGYKLNLTNISFKLGGSTDNGGTSETFSQALRTGTDSFATTVDTSSITLANNTTAATFNALRTVDLSAAAFQNLTGSLEFRFYFWSTSAQVDDILRFDELTLTGTVVAIPEPATWLLFGTGLAALVVLRRIKR